MVNSFSAAKIKIASLDDLFQQNQNNQQVGIVELEVEKLKEYPDHPFHVKDEELTELIDSIRERGVIEPLRVMVGESGDYIIVSGHRRCRAATLAGKKTVPGYIEDLTKEEADLMMVDSNIYREKILPSERAYAYRIKIKALKSLAKSGKVTDMVGESENISGKSIQRYIRLTYLTPEILQDVDEERIAFGTAVNLSYLPMSIQKEIFDGVEDYSSISLECAEIVKNYYKYCNDMTVELFEEIKAGKHTRLDKDCFKQVIDQMTCYGIEHTEMEGENLKARLLEVAEEKCFPWDMRVDPNGILFAGHKYIKWEKIFEYVLPQLHNVSSSCTEQRNPEEGKLEMVTINTAKESVISKKDSALASKPQSKVFQKEGRSPSYEEREMCEMEKELQRWHTSKVNPNIQNVFANTSTVVCCNCDHKDEYIEELECKFEEEKTTRKETQQLQGLLIEAAEEIERLHGKETSLTERIRYALCYSV